MFFMGFPDFLLLPLNRLDSPVIAVFLVEKLKKLPLGAAHPEPFPVRGAPSLQNFSHFQAVSLPGKSPRALAVRTSAVTFNQIVHALK
jgi:hypothetical protein